MGSIKTYFGLLKAAAKEFAADNVMKLSASLAYYTIFSLGPLMLVVVSVTGVFFKTQQVLWQVYWQLKEVIGKETADQVINVIMNLQDQHADSFSILGLVVLVFGATTVFADMQDSINYIWSIKAKPEKGWLKYIKNRLLSFSMVLGLAFLLIVSLVISSLTDLLTEKLFESFSNDYVFLFKGLNLLLVYIVITILFATIYKVLPDARIRWKDTFIGAGFTGLLFILGKYLIGLYIGSSEMGNTYGAAASIVILLLWVYFTAIILYFGAEFTKVYAHKMGKDIQPADHAVFIVKKEATELLEY